MKVQRREVPAYTNSVNAKMNKPAHERVTIVLERSDVPDLIDSLVYETVVEVGYAEKRDVVNVIEERQLARVRPAVTIEDPDVLNAVSGWDEAAEKLCGSRVDAALKRMVADGRLVAIDRNEPAYLEEGTVKRTSATNYATPEFAADQKARHDAVIAVRQAQAAAEIDLYERCLAVLVEMVGPEVGNRSELRGGKAAIPLDLLALALGVIEVQA